jgi:hypothetical protein
MLALLMAFAACYGVLQLAVLGWGARTVRLGTLALAIGTGLYGCGLIAALLQIAYTRILSALSGQRLFDVVIVAGHTVDPVIEELVKIAPLLVIGCRSRARAQWRLTDHLLVGAALGAGFGLLEALLYVGGDAGRALRFPDGWVVPTGLRPPYVPGIEQALTSWLPGPYSVSQLSPVGPDTGFHIVWSAVAGLGVGMLLRWRGPSRLFGLLPVVLVSAAHAAHNYDPATTTHSTAGDMLARPFVTVEPLLGLWPLLALAFAVWSDDRVLRRGKRADPGLLLPGERPDGLSGLAVLGRYAVIRPPYTALVAHRYALLRRTASYARTTPEGIRLAALAYEARARIEVTGTFMAWTRVSLRAVLARGRPRRLWILLVWAVLALPVVVYFLLGTTPGMGGAQKGLASPVIFPVLMVLACAGLALVAWQLAMAVRALPRTWREPVTERAVGVQLRVLSGVGVLLLGGLDLYAWIVGTPAGGRVVSNAHVLNALSDLLLYAGLALLIAGFVFFPPAGIAAVVGGGLVFVPTVTGGFIALEALGLSGVLLAQADSGGSVSSGEEARLRKLGEDPDTKSFRPGEGETAQRIEQERGVTLRRSERQGEDWVDEEGASYDGVGNFDGKFFDAQWPHLQQVIRGHLNKADFVPVDVSKFTPAQVAQVRQFIQNLGPRVFLVGE